MTLKTWLLFLVTETALSLSPGPAVFYVVSQGARGGLGRTLPAAGGILTANGFYFLLSATSLGALLAASGRVYVVLKWLGAAYLIYLGLRAIWCARSSHAQALDSSATPGAYDGRRVYSGALTLQLANPKALLGFIAILPQFIDAHAAVAPQMMMLAATSMVPELFILLGYGWLAHRAALASARFGVGSRMNRWLAWVEGAGLLGCATLVLRFNRGGA